MRRCFYHTVLAAFSFILVASAAFPSDLSRKWSLFFDNVADKRTTTITVLHLPNSTLRMNGEFSSGERVFDTTFTATIRVTTSDGRNRSFQVNEWVPATRGGSTEVKTKVQDFSVPGTITKVMAQVDANVTNAREQVPFYRLPEGEAVNICHGFRANIELQAAGQTAIVQKCDPRTGRISTEKHDLKEPIPLCDGCSTP